MTAGVKNGSQLMSTSLPGKDHILKEHGVAREVQDLRTDLATILGQLVALTVDEFTTPATASNNAVKTSFATSTTAQAYSGAALNGAVGATKMPIPRNITVTAAANGGGYTGSVTVKGLRNGVVVTEAIAITASSTVAGVKMFDSVTELDLVGQPDALGSIQVGFGVVLGLSQPVLARAGGAILVRENMDGTIPTAGAISQINQSYTPNTAPNAAHNYAVYYEVDTSKLLTGTSTVAVLDQAVYGKPGKLGVGSPGQ
jgi:hypothetical protein